MAIISNRFNLKKSNESNSLGYENTSQSEGRGVNWVWGLGSKPPH